MLQIYTIEISVETQDGVVSNGEMSYAVSPAARVNPKPLLNGNRSRVVIQVKNGDARGKDP